MHSVTVQTIFQNFRQTNFVQIVFQIFQKNRLCICCIRRVCACVHVGDAPEFQFLVYPNFEIRNLFPIIYFRNRKSPFPMHLWWVRVCAYSPTLGITHWFNERNLKIILLLSSSLLCNYSFPLFVFCQWFHLFLSLFHYMCMHVWRETIQTLVPSPPRSPFKFDLMSTKCHSIQLSLTHTLTLWTILL